jgi:protein gp37
MARSRGRVMGKNSAISWTHHTFNPWWGCTKVSEECEHCYAETLAKRFGFGWGREAEPRLFGDQHWNDPIRWNREAEKAGDRKRVFCGSMCDVFEEREGKVGALLDELRVRLWKLIPETPWIDWLLLTKRPENIPRMLPFIEIGGERSARFGNVWLGTTIGTAKAWRQRALALAEVPSAVHFWSCEPLLEPVAILCPRCDGSGNDHRAGDGGGCSGDFPDLVIVGGESGANARPCHVEWIRSIQRQCREADVACWTKQLGANAIGDGYDLSDETVRDLDAAGCDTLYEQAKLQLRDRAGADPSEWPADLRYREMPEAKP